MEDRPCRNVPLNDIALDERRVTGSGACGNAVRLLELGDLRIRCDLYVCSKTL